jgi:predicted Fe-Mo cluster-binding NifX family protein
MKVLVSTTGAGLAARVDPRFGRARWFALVDDADRVEMVSNEGEESLQGAGIQAAELASRLGVQVVITGHCGPNAFQALKAAGITVLSGAQGTVAEALAAYRAGQLLPATGPDVRGHWT